MRPTLSTPIRSAAPSMARLLSILMSPISTRLCFDLSQPPADKSIEDLFHEAEQRRQTSEPMRRLANHPDEGRPQFPQAAAPLPRCDEKTVILDILVSGTCRGITVSLPRIRLQPSRSENYFLLGLARWCPRDGYRISMNVDNASFTFFLKPFHVDLCLTCPTSSRRVFVSYASEERQKPELHQWS